MSWARAFWVGTACAVALSCSRHETPSREGSGQERSESSSEPSKGGEQPASTRAPTPADPRIHTKGEHTQAIVQPLVSANAQPAGKRVCPPCVGSSAPDPELEARIEAQYENVAEALEAPELDMSCMCFGETESVSVEGGNLQLAADWPLAEKTARAAHLAYHRLDPPWREGDRADCADRVRRALLAEARAHALELQLRAALGVYQRRYLFEQDLLGQPEEERVSWLVDYFERHPEGDGIVPGFVVQYSARCRQDPRP
jgi:hypothetical protein